MRIGAIVPLRLIKARTGSLLMAVAAVGLAFGGLQAGAASAHAATAAAPVVTLTGSLGILPASTATVVVRAQLARNVNSAGVPQELDEVPVTSATIASPVFSIPVPGSSTLQQAELQGHGIVNFNILVTSGSSETSEYVSAPLTVSATAGNAAELAIQNAHHVQAPAFPAFHTMSAAQMKALSATPQSGGPSCNWYAYGSEYQDRTRVGEAHVANVSGVSDTFWFKYQNDMTISVGLSSSPDSGYSFDGNIGLTNSLSANGSHTFGSGSVQYVNDTTNYQRYELMYGGVYSCRQYMIQAVGSDADVYQGINTPPVNPWGGCRNDPLYATLAPGSTWSRDQSSAQYYSTVASLFGFTFSGSDGFTTDVEHDYSSSGGAPETTYICGDASGEAPTQAPILYNTP